MIIKIIIPSTDPFSWSVFHRDRRLGEMAGTNLRFFVNDLLSFHEEVCKEKQNIRYVKH